MDGCYKCCEINTVSLTYGSLQLLQWNNDTTREKMDGCNRWRQITDFIQYIHSWNQGGIIISNYDISLLQLLFCKDILNLKECVVAIVLLKQKEGHSSNRWLQLELQINLIPFKYQSNTLYIRNSWLQSLFLKIPYLLKNGQPQLLSWNKETLYPEKTCSLLLNAVT